MIEDRVIRFAYTRSLYDGVNKQVRMPWDVFVNWLPKNRCVLDDKYKAKMIVLGKFKNIDEGAVIATEKETRFWPDGKKACNAGDIKLTEYGEPMPSRCEDNLVGYDAFTLDFDKGTPINKLLERFDGLELVYYTTYSHFLFCPVLGINKPKCRIIIPFNEFCPLAEFKARKQTFLKLSGAIKDDKSTFDPSRAFFLPSNPEKTAKHARDGYIKGKFFDWAQIPIDPKKPDFVKTTSNININQKPLTGEEKQDIVSQLMWRQFEVNKMFMIACGFIQHGFDYGDFRTVWTGARFWDKSESRIKASWQDALNERWDISIGFLKNCCKGEHDHPNPHTR